MIARAASTTAVKVATVFQPSAVGATGKPVTVSRKRSAPMRPQVPLIAPVTPPALRTAPASISRFPAARRWTLQRSAGSSLAGAIQAYAPPRLAVSLGVRPRELLEGIG